MTFMLIRGNKYYLAGEVLMYAECRRKDGTIFFPALFFSSDDARLDKFVTKTNLPYEIEGERCAALPKTFATQKDLFAIDVRNLARADVCDNEEHAQDRCIEEGLRYMTQYRTQLNAQYAIDFHDSQYFIDDKQLFSNNLDTLVGQMLDGCEGDHDRHQAEAAASLLRRIGETKRGVYALMSNMTEFACDREESFDDRRWTILSLKREIKAKVNKNAADEAVSDDHKEEDYT